MPRHLRLVEEEWPMPADAEPEDQTAELAESARYSFKKGIEFLAYSSLAVSKAYLSKKYGEMWPGEAPEAIFVGGTLGSIALGNLINAGDDLLNLLRKRRLDDHPKQAARPKLYLVPPLADGDTD